MEKIIIKYCIGMYTYVALRTIAYAPPRKKEEYMTDRVGRTVMYTLSAPWTAPICVYRDIKNLEHTVRKMPGPIDRTPWY
jgi:hypothetical protein